MSHEQEKFILQGIPQCLLQGASSYANIKPMILYAIVDRCKLYACSIAARKQQRQKVSRQLYVCLQRDPMCQKSGHHMVCLFPSTRWSMISSYLSASHPCPSCLWLIALYDSCSARPWDTMLYLKLLTRHSLKTFWELLHTSYTFGCNPSTLLLLEYVYLSMFLSLAQTKQCSIPQN